MEDESKPGGDAGDSSAGKPADVEQPSAPTVPDAGTTPPALESPSEPAAETPAAKTAAPAAADAPAAKVPTAPAAKAEDKPAPPAKPAKPAKKPAVMETEPWIGPLVDALKERFGDKIREFLSYRSQNFLIADLDAAVSIIEYLKTEQDFDYLVDVTAVDDPKQEKRFELIWNLYSFASNERVRIKARAAEDESAQTAVGVHITADWLEREVFDMFGIRFDGHPNMTRILLPEEWQGHPLRKDYSIIQQDEDWVRQNLGIESGQ